MKNYIGDDDFGFESNNDQNSFDYNNISGLGESDYENEDLFNTEVSNVNATETFDTFKPDQIIENNEDLGYNLEFPIDYKTLNHDLQGDIPKQNFELEDNNKTDINSFESEQQISEEEDNSFINYNQNNDFWVEYNNETNQNTSFPEEEPVVENLFDETQNYGHEINSTEQNNLFETDNLLKSEDSEQLSDEVKINSPESSVLEEDKTANDFIPQTEHNESTETDLLNNSSNVDREFLEPNGDFDSSSLQNDYEYPIVEPSIESKTEIFEETPIEELNKLTEFEEDKIPTTDIKSLFDRVGVNVKEASDIFKKNTEMKEKIDARFEELKKLQSEVEKAKKSQYDEINSYKEEVLNKLTEKKDEIEKRLNKLREFQASLEKEKQEFEQYKKSQNEEIERVQKEVQDAYDSRREELNHIEDVLRKQKDALDEERSQLSLDRIQYESDKNELANNLLKFNEIVDSFTNGMDKINKE